MNRTPSLQRGFTLIEVLITLVIIAIGLLGLAGLQGKMQVNEVEAYQRSQAVLLAQDMSNRIRANDGLAASYVTGTTTPLGTGAADVANCATGTASIPARDLCEWSKLLKGAAESQSGTNFGAMIGARGCVEQVQAANPATGVCQPAIFRVSVAWQGLNETVSPSVNLACGLNQYGTEPHRRLITSTITLGLNQCI